MASETGANLATILTPPGMGAIAVVRLRGPHVVQFLEKCFSKTPMANRCAHGELRDGEKVIDDPVVVLGSDGAAADINLHGGIWVVQACLDLAERNGFRVIDSPLPPLPSFMLDGADELENEILASLPLAVTETAVRVLLGQSTAWNRIGSGPIDRAEAERMLSDRSLHWLLHPPGVAIVGIPNAGKSTLANGLFASERSITADVSGTTRDWVGDKANLDGLVVTLVDTPGIRSIDDPIEAEAIRRGEDQAKLADLVVLVLDATRLADPSQRALVDRFPEAVQVLNKIDAANLSNVAGATLSTIATKGTGLDRVRAAIRRQFQCEPLDMTAARCWTERQRELIRGRIAAI